MMPVWFPWIFVGGSIFILLCFIGSKLKQKEYQFKQFLQDFISGAILIGFIGVLMPDVFPTIDLSSVLPKEQDSDFELQVGPPRRVGR